MVRTAEISLLAKLSLKGNPEKNFINVVIFYYTVLVKISVTWILSFLFHFCKEFLNIFTNLVVTKLKVQSRGFLSSKSL